MATRTNVVLEDDLTGETENVQTVTFGLSNVNYEIDLTEKNADDLRAAFSKYVNAARKVGRAASTSAPQSRGATRSSSDYDPAAVRAWASSKGIAVNARGRIKAGVVEQFRAAGN
jgi:hypothetical protein